jgi:chlorite dismutase
MARPVLVTFSASDVGAWTIDRLDTVVGEGLPSAARLDVSEDRRSQPSAPAWSLRGFTSNERYVKRNERSALTVVQQPLGRADANRAALIPVRKSEAWWEMTQDERRAILEERSHHIAIGLEYLPAVARRLHHSRDLGDEFDFLTWFEYSPETSEAFEELVARLRRTEEWLFVEREVDIRLTRSTV